MNYRPIYTFDMRPNQAAAETSRGQTGSTPIG